MSYDHQDNLPTEEAVRYKRKLSVVGLQKCPYKMPSDVWMNNPLEWPKVEYPDLYNFLIKSPRVYSQEAMENYKSLEAYKFFISGWVQTVVHSVTPQKNVIFRAEVRPSYRVTEAPHHPWVAVGKSGGVLAGHCDCTAGLGETCSHVAALLFKVEVAVRLGYTSAACTDLPCTWNATFTKNIEPRVVAQIKFYKEASRTKILTHRRRPEKNITASTEEEKHRFLRAISICSPTTVGLSGFGAYAQAFFPKKTATSLKCFPAPMRKLYSEKYSGMSPGMLETAMHNVLPRISKEDIDNVEVHTREQSASMLWHQQRAGRITASTAHQALHTNILHPSTSLIKRICSADAPQLTTAPIIWGRTHEGDAFEAYRSLMLSTDAPASLTGRTICVSQPKSHINFSVQTSGLHIAQDKPFLAASPDGIICCDCCGVGVLEIKCPHTFRDRLLSEAVLENTFCIDQAFHLKENHMYYTQIQMQMYVCGASYADFVIWTLKDFLVLRVKRCEQFVNDMVTKLSGLWTKAVLPELLTRHLELGDRQMQDDSIASGSSSNNDLFCVCQSREDGREMVGCDKCDGWFHPVCIKLKRLPTSKHKPWYCPKCRKSKK